jgi:hypothetical protein
VLETAKGTIRIETNSETEIPIIIRQGDRDVEHLTVSRGAGTRGHPLRHRICFPDTVAAVDQGDQ